MKKQPNSQPARKVHAKRVVPEKVTERRDVNKEKFLEKLEDMPIVQVAASQAGVHRSTYYRWYDDDFDFREKADKALTAGLGFVNDMMESLLIKSAKEGKMPAISFWLKSRHPAYMEVRRHQHAHRHAFDQPPSPLTEERKKEIARAVQAWSQPDDGDERDSDYESGPVPS